MKKIWIPALVLVATAGCQSFAPQAESVRVTMNDGDVAGCTYLGDLAGRPAKEPTHGAVPELKDSTKTKGGNVLLVGSYDATTLSGAAYRCGATTTLARR